MVILQGMLWRLLKESVSGTKHITWYKLVLVRVETS